MTDPNKMTTINIRLTEQDYQRLKEIGKPGKVAQNYIQQYLASITPWTISYTDYGSSRTMSGVRW